MHRHGFGKMAAIFLVAYIAAPHHNGSNFCNGALFNASLWKGGIKIAKSTELLERISRLQRRSRSRDVGIR